MALHQSAIVERRNQFLLGILLQYMYQEMHTNAYAHKINKTQFLKIHLKEMFIKGILVKKEKEKIHL